MGHLLHQPAYTTSETTFDLFVHGIVRSASLADLTNNVFRDLFLCDFIDLTDGRLEDGVDGPMVRCPEFSTMIRFEAELRDVSSSMP